MISGKSLRRALLGPIILASSWPGLAANLEDLERRLETQPPVTIAFVEYRFARVLKKPARASGTLQYLPDGVLVREVDQPYRELTEVSGDSVSVRREGRAERRFSLERAPPLRVLLHGFRALLDGKLTAMRADFDVRLEESGRGWAITLTPLDAALARRLTSLRIDGADDRPACLEISMPDGASFTLLGPAARVLESPTPAELQAMCRTPRAAP